MRIGNAAIPVTLSNLPTMHWHSEKSIIKDNAKWKWQTIAFPCLVQSYRTQIAARHMVLDFL